MEKQSRIRSGYALSKRGSSRPEDFFRQRQAELAIAAQLRAIRSASETKPSHPELLTWTRRLREPGHLSRADPRGRQLFLRGIIAAKQERRCSAKTNW